MALINLKTNLKILKYGKDIVGGGSSNQPYIKSSIPNSISDIGKTGGPDFLLRGGTLSSKIILQDTSRLTKMFFDLKSPKGVLFTAKQNILSLTNVNSNAGYIAWEEVKADKSGNFIQRLGSTISTFIKNNISINQGVYTSLSTIGQTVGSPLGLHLNKQGLNPFIKTDRRTLGGNIPLTLPTYLNTIYSDGEGNKSRLLNLIPKINNINSDPLLYKYIGGPGATLGVGTTSIMMLGDQRTGVNNSIISRNYTLGKFKIEGDKIKYINSEYKPGLNKNKNIIDIQLAYGATTKYFSEYKISTANTSVDLFDNSPINPIDIKTIRFESGIQNIIPRLTYTQENISEITPYSKGGEITNFIDKIGEDNKKTFKYISKSLDYSKSNIEQRVNLGDPGRKGRNKSSYSVGIINNSNKTKFGIDDIKSNSGYKNALDQINALPLYKSDNVSSTKEAPINDLVKFRIGIIDNNNPSLKTFIHFRAFIDGFSDTYGSSWSDQKYMGRGEKFYKYNGFDRKISLSWIVAAQSKQELIPMYQKLNYLASACAPDYSGNGYMRGNLISLTVGGWLYEQVGIMEGITLDIPNESPWEIGINDGYIKGIEDKSVKELPMIIKVSGFNFIPIHDFVPRVQQNNYNGNKGFISNYGKERYIGLAAESSPIDNNYGGKKDNINYIP